jgi:hypothetical protein
MKVALCFIISYEHILNKEEIWREWIEPNKDFINVYFYYKDFNKIKSDWIRKHTIPPNYIYETSYYHVIPAYLSVMRFALTHDNENNWFCMLTDSCCPIISPKKFRYLFYENYNKSIISWKKSWWNIDFHKRANLSMLPKDFHLANDPWFVLKRENVLQIVSFVNVKKEMTKIICAGGLANESLFAIILYCYKELESSDKVISAITHITDWSRMTSATSPHIFKYANEKDIKFIDTELEKNKFSMFIRKISPEFPNEILREYIYQKYKDCDNNLILKEPIFFIVSKIKNRIYFYAPYMIIIIILYKYLF